MRGGRRWVPAALVALGLGLAGCSAAPAPPPTATLSPSAWPAPGLPAGSTALRDLGFSNAPEDFGLPPGVRVTPISNQLSVITAGFSPADGATVLAFLKAHLPEMGYAITAASADSVVFAGQTWHGAFTMSPAIALLTLRHGDQ